MNTRPWQATLAAAAQRRQHAGEDLEKALQVLRRALEKNAGLLESDIPEIIQRSSHAVAQCAGAVIRICEALELDARLTKLEGRFEDAQAR